MSMCLSRESRWEKPTREKKEHGQKHKVVKESTSGQKQGASGSPGTCKGAEVKTEARLRSTQLEGTAPAVAWLLRGKELMK